MIYGKGGQYGSRLKRRLISLSSRAEHLRLAFTFTITFTLLPSNGTRPNFIIPVANVLREIC
jgi:hypothetical protein